MRNASLLCLLGLLCIAISTTDAANVLVLTPFGSKSHKIFYMGIVNALAERGHNVTIVSAFKNSKAKPNINDIAIPSLEVTTEMLSNVFEDGGADDLMRNLFLESPRICIEGLAEKEVQNLKNENYDIVLISIFFDGCYLSLIHHFKVPFIFLSPAGLIGPFTEMLGSIDFPSFLANKFTGAQFPLSFMQRFQTIALNAALDMAGKLYMFPKMEELCRAKGLCPPDMPSFVEFNQKASLAIINSVRGLEQPPRPSMPNIIYAGGAHIRPGKSLPEELEKWVQGSGEEGFIFFSLGSALNPKNLPEKHRKTLMNVFGSLRQRVLWKWEEETMPGQPPNVKLSKWLPQQDILAHKKLKLFITHGGLLSTMESTYNGIPILGMPVFADQHSNMKEAAGEGWGRVLTWSELSEDSLKLVLNEILSNNSLREISVKRSAIMKDVPIHPAEEAAFWVEYVLRHDGARHLRSPLFEMYWYEVYNIDIWAVILLLIIIVVYFNFLITKAFLRKCFGISRGNAKPKKKKNKKE